MRAAGSELYTGYGKKMKAVSLQVVVESTQILLKMITTSRAKITPIIDKLLIERTYYDCSLQLHLWVTFVITFKIFVSKFVLNYQNFPKNIVCLIPLLMLNFEINVVFAGHHVEIKHFFQIELDKESRK